MPVIDIIERIRVSARQLVDGFIADELAVLAVPASDPFDIEHDCTNPAGHATIASCGDIVCPHCAKVFWS
jgi:hypothetical protein